MIKHAEDGLLLHVKLTPRARRNKIIGEVEGELRISLNAPPVDGAANKALIVFISMQMKIPKSSIVILRGDKSRSKQLLIDTELRADELRDLLSLEL